MKLKFKNTPEQVELIKAMGSKRPEVSREASEAFAQELSLDKFGSKLLLFEGNDPASLKNVIIEVLKFITVES